MLVARKDLSEERAEQALGVRGVEAAWHAGCTLCALVASR
jgi:hypothetical protein